MTVAIVYSRALSGVHAPLVTVEVHLGGGMPAFNLVGLPETEVKTSRERVRAALPNAEFGFPRCRLIATESGRFDLPDLKPALLLQLNSHPFCAIQQSPEMIASKRVVGMLADKRRESLHRRAVAALELGESLAILRLGRGPKRVFG